MSTYRVVSGKIIIKGRKDARGLLCRAWYRNFPSHSLSLSHARAIVQRLWKNTSKRATRVFQLHIIPTIPRPRYPRNTRSFNPRDGTTRTPRGQCNGFIIYMILISIFSAADNNFAFIIIKKREIFIFLQYSPPPFSSLFT